MKLVISLGGSIINNGVIDTKFLDGFKKLVESSKEHSFVIVCGGGKTARDYIKAGEEFKIHSVRLDEIGMAATALNGELVAALLNVRRSKDINEAVSKDRLVVTNGLFPGVTTDFDAVSIAGIIGADAVINISNVPGLYNKDPRTNKDALFLDKLSYKDLIKMANEYELGHGANFIFDLAASKLASRTRVKLVFLEGLDNLAKFIKGEKFKGSIINE